MINKAKQQLLNKILKHPGKLWNNARFILVKMVEEETLIGDQDFIKKYNMKEEDFEEAMNLLVQGGLINKLSFPLSSHAAEMPSPHSAALSFTKKNTARVAA